MFEQNENKNVHYGRKKKSSLGTIVGVVFIFAAFVIYNVFVGALKEGISTANAAIDADQARIATIEETIASYEGARQELDLSSEVKLMDSLNSIPERMYQDRVILDVLKLSDDNDIEMNSITFGQGSFGTIGALRINASFSGNYGDLINFLEDVEGNGRLFKVNSVTIQMGNESILELKRVNFSVSMEAFYQSK